MRHRNPFKPNDLQELDERLLERAVSVVSMREVHDGTRWEQVIGMRHDVDNIIEPAVRFAEWEAARGYRSTYYILHTAPYWRNELLLRSSLEIIVECGHEVGIHNNAVAEALVTNRDPRELLMEAIATLHNFGFDVHSTVAHGDSLCRGDDGKVRFVNDEMFRECARGTFGDTGRKIGELTLRPTPLESFGLDFDANWIGRGAYLSDSGGKWSDPGFDATADGFPFDGQLHMLIHPDWWGQAFITEGIAA